jgi:hypothetical protein
MWHLLGLEPTSDTKAVKRAYAQRLKLTRPEDDPQGFQQLRQAYEWALAQCADESRARVHIPISSDLPFTPVAPPASPEPAATEHPCQPATEPPGEATDEQAQAAVSRCLQQLFDAQEDAVDLPDTDAALGLLWRSPTWQPLQAQRCLEDAWRRTLHGLLDDTASMDVRLERLCVAQTLYDHCHWRLEDGAPLLHAWAAMLCLMAQREGGPMAAQARLLVLLQRATWQAPSHQRLLAQHLGQHLWWQYLEPEAACQVSPAQQQQLLAWLDLLVHRFDWAHDVRASTQHAEIQQLLALWLRQQDAELLRRIADGQEVNPHVPRAVAEALLQPSVRPEDRSAVRGGVLAPQKQGSWQVQMRTSLAWIDANAPQALSIIHPSVLAWWRKEHVEISAWWLWLAIPTGLVGGIWLMNGVEAYWQYSGLGLTMVFLLGSIVCGLLGMRMAGALAWVRLQWRVKIYAGWLRLDASINQFIGSHWSGWLRFSQFMDLGMTRDLIPASVFLTWQFFSMWQQEGESPAVAMRLAAFFTVVVAMFWRGTLRLLAKP